MTAASEANAPAEVAPPTPPVPAPVPSGAAGKAAGVESSGPSRSSSGGHSTGGEVVTAVAPEVDLAALVTADPPPCEALFARNGREPQRCGRPSAAVARLTCTACGSRQLWVCAGCVTAIHAGHGRRTCTSCRAPITIEVIS